GPASTLGKRDTERLKFRLSPAHTRPENQTAITQLVKARQFFCEHNGMTVWNDQDRGPQTNPTGDSCQISQDRDDVVVHRAVARLNRRWHHRMIGNPYRVKPEILRHA